MYEYRQPNYTYPAALPPQGNHTGGFVGQLEDILKLEQDILSLGPVIGLSSGILSDLLMRKGALPPMDIAKVKNFLQSATKLAQAGDEETARMLIHQARDALQEIGQWLTVTDFGISAFILRTYLEKKPLPEESLAAILRYYLAKNPHAHNDRDKLDYLMLEYFDGKLTLTDEPNPKILLDIEDLLEPLVPQYALPEPSQLIEKSLEALYDLRALLASFNDFDKLIHSKLVERSRAIKIFLAESFYHPSVLPRIVHFNLEFRKKFDALLEAQLAKVRKVSESRIDEAWEVLRAIQDVYERMELPELHVEEGGGALKPDIKPDLILGRPLDSESERIPLERLQRGDVDLRKDTDLQGIITRIKKFVAEIPPEASGQDTMLPLRQTQIRMTPAERAAFLPTDQPPLSAGTMQMGLALVAWMEEELEAYREKAGEKYVWKPHFDMLSHAVARSVELLHVIRSILHDEAPQEEATWFGPLISVALRLGESLNHVLPVFVPELTRESTT